MTKAEFFKLMADNQLTVNFDDKLTTVDESERSLGMVYWQEWSKEWINKWTVGPNQETADWLLRYWNGRRFLRNERRALTYPSHSA